MNLTKLNEEVNKRIRMAANGTLATRYADALALAKSIFGSTRLATEYDTSGRSWGGLSVVIQVGGGSGAPRSMQWAEDIKRNAAHNTPLVRGLADRFKSQLSSKGIALEDFSFGVSDLGATAEVFVKLRED